MSCEVLDLTPETLHAVGLRYCYEVDGERRWKVSPKGFYRSQFIRTISWDDPSLGKHKQMVTFIRDFLHQELVAYLDENPESDPVAVISMAPFLDGVDSSDIPTSRHWTAIEHTVIDDLFKTVARDGKRRRKKKKKKFV